MAKKRGKIYIIPSSLGTKSLLEELNPKSIEIVRELKHFVVETPKVARRHLRDLDMDLRSLDMKILDEHTKYKEIPELLNPIYEGYNIGLLSDAGCPGVADPGSPLILLAHKQNIQVIPLTGPSSVTLALMASGLNGQKFSFEGYLPKDRGQRIHRIKTLESLSAKFGQTQIFIETPYRNVHMFKDLVNHCEQNTLLCVASNLTNEKEYIKTQSIKDWQVSKIPPINRVPVIFLISARHK
jgi:16S rRNA (cytidine1402-2'-O)-methyltransferase